MTSTEIEVIQPERMSLAAAGEFTRAEIDVAIATAKKYPRDTEFARNSAIAAATENPEIAGACRYTLPRGRGEDAKTISGPSVRLAEIAAMSWGNLRFGSRVIAEESNFIVAQGYCQDLERNIFGAFEVRRRITDKKGRRYNDDMIGVTGAAASAIAFRNAVLKVLPRTYVSQIDQAAHRLLVDDTNKDLVNKRNFALRGFKDWYRVDVERILNALGRDSIEAITAEDVATLSGIRTAIADGDTTADEAFPKLGEVHEVGTRMENAERARTATAQGGTEKWIDRTERLVNEPDDSMVLSHLLGKVDVAKRQLGRTFTKEAPAGSGKLFFIDQKTLLAATVLAPQLAEQFKQAVMIARGDDAAAKADVLGTIAIALANELTAEKERTA